MHCISQQISSSLQELFSWCVFALWIPQVEQELQSCYLCAEEATVSSSTELKQHWCQSHKHIGWHQCTALAQPAVCIVLRTACTLEPGAAQTVM